MTEDELIVIQLDNARKARRHHLQFARQYRRLMAFAYSGVLLDDYWGQYDWHKRQARKWRIRQHQLEGRA